MSDGALLLYTLFHVALIAVPGIAAVLLAGQRGTRDIVALLSIWLVASGAAAMATFWAYFAAHALGVVMSFGVPATSIGIAWWSIARMRCRFPWSEVAWPVVLWALGTVFIVCLGFLHGGTSQPLATSATRFSGPLPNDNYLPTYFAEGLFELGRFRAPPPLADWISSDRPPLQSGFVLAARPWGWSTSLVRYELLGVALQQVWIIGAWALLAGARVRRVTRGLVLGGLLVSDVVIVNGFYVWPKLFTAGFLLAATAIVVTDRWTQARSRGTWGALAGALLALAMLGHGSSIYAVLPLAALALFRGRPNLRFVGALVVAGAALYLPWSAYQHYADPPGNRLVNWHLAGDIAIDTKPTSQAIIDAYSTAGIRESITNKIDNVGTVVGGAQGVEDLAHAGRLAFDGDWDEAVTAVRQVRFFSLLHSTGLFMLAPFLVIMLWRRRRHAAEWVFAVRCAGIVGLGVVLWVLLQFGNEYSRAWLHVGSYAVPLLAITACITGVAALSMRAAAFLVGANALSVLVLYTPSVGPDRSADLSIGLFTAGLLALVGFVAVCLLGGPMEDTRTDASRQMSRSAAS